ncbi:MAG: hypothetical protein ACJ76Y_03825 [Thermoanaerobaculia bacterium]
MDDPSQRSWTAAGIDAAAYEALAEGLPASEVWSLLLGVLARRAERRPPADLLRQWEQDRFVQPAFIDQRTLNALDGHLLAAAEGFEAIELSPLAPLGSCSAVGLASQNKTVSTARGTEVVSDPTNGMALECARRLRRDSDQIIRLATCHRCVRAQEIPKRPGHAAHFRIFCLATAGRERKDHDFTVEALAEQIATHLAALDRLGQHGYLISDVRVKVLSTPSRAGLADRIAATVQGATVSREAFDHPYYDGLRFLINVRNREGTDLFLSDGGAFDWLGKLTSNRRLTFVASGMGSQLVAYLLRA